MDYITELAIPGPTPDLSAMEVHALLTTHVRRLLRTERDWLLSKLYRLDIREPDIKRILTKGDDAAAGLALLILARHHERQATRAQYKPLPEPSDPELGDMSW